MRPLLLLAIAAALALGACGKKAPLRVPEGREAEFTYPQQYPAPRSVVPAGTLSGTTSAPAASRGAPDGISVTPEDERRTRTRVYGSE